VLAADGVEEKRKYIKYFLFSSTLHHCVKNAYSFEEIKNRSVTGKTRHRHLIYQWMVSLRSPF